MIMPGDNIRLELRLDLDHMKAAAMRLLSDRDNDVRRMVDAWFDTFAKNGGAERALAEAVNRECESAVKDVMTRLAWKLSAEIRKKWIPHAVVSP